MTHIYISYARPQYSIAVHFASLLERAGLDVFIDTGVVPSNGDGSDLIRREMDRASFLLLFWSVEARDSPKVEAEWHYFLDQGKPIITALTASTSPLPYRLMPLNWVDVTRPVMFDIALETILDIVRERLPARLSPDEVRQKRLDIQRTRERLAEEQAKQSIYDRTTESSPIPMLLQAHRYLEEGDTREAIVIFTHILLDRSSAESRIEAVRALSKLRAASADLIQTLHNDPSPEVRQAAARALAHFPSQVVRDALQLAALADADMGVRVYTTLIDLYIKQPNLVQFWLDKLAGTRNEALRAVVSEAQLFANELVRMSGHVFVSYSRRDAEAFTLQLIEDVRRREKFRLWIDTNLTPGTENWKKAIAKAIEQCSLLVLILSPAVHESKWISEEVSYAEQLGKDRLFVKYRDTHIPFGMAEMQGLRDDLTFEDYPEEMFEAMIDELHRRNIPRSE